MEEIVVYKLVFNRLNYYITSVDYTLAIDKKISMFSALEKWIIWQEMLECASIVSSIIIIIIIKDSVIFIFKCLNPTVSNRII